MAIWTLIKQLRESLGLSQTQFAVRLGCTESYIRSIERPQPHGFMPSKKLIRKIAAEFSASEEERKSLEKELLAEKVKTQMPEIAEQVSMNEMEKKFLTPANQGMPIEFLRELKQALSSSNKDFYKKAEINKETLQAVLSGKCVLERKAVVSLAMALNKPVEDFLLLSGYLPSGMNELAAHKGAGDMFRALSGLSPDTVNDVIDIINNMLSIYRKTHKK